MKKDKNKPMTNIVEFKEMPQCHYCKNFLHDNICKAYPKGIPVCIMKNQIYHIKPLPGDNDIQYEVKLEESKK